MTCADSGLDLSFSLDGKVAVVTGGASGIGAAIASTFVTKRAQVAIVDQNIDAAQVQAGELGHGTRAFVCNVADAASVTAVTRAVLAEFGRIDVLVNCAGLVALAPAEDLALEAWDATLDVNLKGTFLMSQAVGRAMLEQGRGKIVNLASQAASVGLDQHAAYCASKAGVLGLTRVLAVEWAPQGVTVNSISPTVVLTDLGRKAWDGAKGEAMRALIPTGRFAEPEEIAALALFLASDGSDMINGADILVDGGFTVH